MTTADLIAVMNARQDRAGRLAGGNLRAAALGIRRPLHRLEQHREGQATSTTTASSSPACRCAAPAPSLPPAARPRCRSASTTSACRRSAPARRRERRAGDGDAPGLPRRQPRLYGRSSPTARSCASSRRRARTSRRAAAVWLHLPPRALPGAWWAEALQECPRARNNWEECAMKKRSLSRRDVLKGSAALGAPTSSRRPIRAAAPPPAADHARADRGGQEGRQGRLVHLGRPAGRREGRQGRSRRNIPGIAVRVERSGAERVFQRIGQEYCEQHPRGRRGQSSDAAHFIVWKRDGWLAPYVPEDVAKHYPAEHKDPDGMFASFRAWLCVIGYNTNLVKPEDAPKSFADLLDPEMDGQDRQGASGLQRHDHDRDLPDVARSRLGAISRSSPSRASCRCSRRPIRRRSSRSASAPSWPTATNTTCSSSRRRASRSRSSIRPKARR